MIFNLFKPKPTLKELIPDGFVDIHSHILPGIDDGAKNIEESLALISEMKKLGFSKIIGTPHTYTGLYDNTNDSIQNAFNNLKDNLDEEIKLDYASEYMLDNEIFYSAKNKKLLCLKRNHVLVEMSYLSPPTNLYEIIYELKVNGYSPILAHPERYLFYKNNFREFKSLKEKGLMFQANLLSSTGYYGKDVLRLLNKLLENNLIDFVGSDIHNINHIKSFYNRVQISNKKLLEKSILKTKEVFCN